MTDAPAVDLTPVITAQPDPVADVGPGRRREETDAHRELNSQPPM
ncbi:hypothetical protein ACIRPX_18930 [Streptomyces sp. NPDC101225]